MTYILIAAALANFFYDNNFFISLIFIQCHSEIIFGTEYNYPKDKNKYTGYNNSIAVVSIDAGTGVLCVAIMPL